MELVLASQSPRRKELLTLLGHPFRVQAASVDETMEELPIAQAVARLSYRKAAAIDAGESQIVIGADTVVVLDGKPLGKPKDAEDAARMLRSLSGKTHQVMTGVCVLKGERVLTHTEVTEVTFRSLTEQEIINYVATKEPMDKAEEKIKWPKILVLLFKLWVLFWIFGLPRIACPNFSMPLRLLMRTG